jgi:hypothetical protein
MTLALKLKRITEASSSSAFHITEAACYIILTPANQLVGDGANYMVASPTPYPLALHLRN